MSPKSKLSYNIGVNLWKNILMNQILEYINYYPKEAKIVIDINTKWFKKLIGNSQFISENKRG